MSFTTPTTGTTGTTSTTGTTATNPNSSTLPITQNQFLEMLMAELKNQNPMNPNSSDPMQFVTELAQFTQVEQETNTAQSTSTIASGQNSATAIALLGHTVTYTDPTTGNAGHRHRPERRVQLNRPDPDDQRNDRDRRRGRE